LKKTITVKTKVRPVRDNVRETVLVVGRDVSSGYQIRNHRGTWRFRVHGENGRVEQRQAIKLNVSQSLKLTYKSGEGGKAYVDGEKIGTFPDKGDIIYPEVWGNAPTVASHGGNLYFFKGSISEVQIYNAFDVE